MTDPAPVSSDTPTAVPPVDTPAPGTDTQPDATQTNWEERYKEAQAWGTRNAQRISELEAYEQVVNAWNSDDVEAQKWAAAQLGVQLSDEPTDTPANGQDPELLRRLEALETRHATQQQEAQEAAEYQTYRQWTDPQLQKMGIPARLHDIVADTARAIPRIHTPQGETPDLAGAWKQLEALAPAFSEMQVVQDTVKQAWANTKRAPHMTQAGQDALPQPNLDEMSATERREWMAQRLMDLEG